MRCHLFLPVTGIAVLLALLPCSFLGPVLGPQKVSAQQDLLPITARVVLKSGGELSGMVSTQKDEATGRATVTVEKTDGSVITLDRSRLVSKVEPVNSLMIEYQRRSAGASTVDQHRKLLAWCLEQTSGRRVFESQIEIHAHHVLLSEPNDTAARKALGFERDGDGGWIQEEQYYAEHGYTRDGTSWTPIQAAQLAARQDQVNQRMADRKEALRKWLRAAKRVDASPDELTKELFGFCDELALPLVEKAAKRENSPAIRALLIEGIGQLPGPAAMRKLIWFSMNDPDEAVSERALTLLTQPHFDSQAAALAYTEFFASRRNDVIQRAAFAIGELGGTSAIGKLIEVLVTTHTERNPNALGAGRLNPTFRSDGGSGLATGGGPQTFTLTRENARVLGALKILTDQDFGFDIPQWRSWHIEANTHYDVNVRND